MAKRRRVGLLLPSTNSVMEPDFYRVAPPEVTIHTERMFLGSASGGEAGELLWKMNDDIENAARYLARARVELMVYGCTSGSFLEGPGYDQQVMGRIEKVSGVPAIATSYAAAEALREKGLRRLAVTSPYNEAINRRLKIFLEGNGFEVLSIAGNSQAGDPNDQDPEMIMDFVPKNIHPEAEGVFCSCTAWRALEVVGELERRLGKPVVTSNQASIWLALKRLGITTCIEGYGSLLESLAPVVT